MEFWVYSAAAIGIPITYVSSLYLFDGEQLHWNHPQTIRRRFVAVGLSTVLSAGGTFALLSWNYENPAKVMGFVSDENILLNLLKVVGMSLSLYLGSFAMDLVDGSWRHWFVWREWLAMLSDLTHWRSAVVAPLTEEFCFRGCAAPLLSHCFGLRAALFVNPLLFSICHYHHLHNDVKHGSTLTYAIFQRTIQAAYTYLFGIYATLLWISTGSIWPAVVAHSICNVNGLPRVLSVSTVRPKSAQPLLYVAHFAGLFLFTYLLISMGPFIDGY